MSKAFDTAVRLLSRREHGTRELTHKLKQKGCPGSEVEEALIRCQELDLQNERRFVESYCRSRIRQGYGPLKITQELNNKGIVKELIQDILQLEQKNWLSYALQAWEKKTNGQKKFTVPELQKYQRFLIYRGFSHEIVSAVIHEML